MTNKSSLTILSLAAILTVGMLHATSNSDGSIIPSALGQVEMSSPTVKVSGDASVKVESDQVVMIVVKQSQPTDLIDALKEQKEVSGKLVTEIKSTIGDDKKSSITVGQMNVNPYYSGPSYSDVGTFTVYSSTSVNTDIENFSTIIKKLTEAGFGFESVYASPMILAPYGLQAASSEQASNDTATEVPKEDTSKQITINVALNTKPGKLNDVLEEYQSKYEKLTQLLNEIGIPSDKIQPANVSVNPMYYGPGQNTSYNTYSQVIVKTSLNNIEAVNKVAQKQGAYVESTYLTISDGLIEQKRDELNKLAFDNAKSKAESLAKLAGLKLKGIQSIESNVMNTGMYGGYIPYKGVYISQPYYYGGMGNELSASITVEFKMGK